MKLNALFALLVIAMFTAVPFAVAEGNETNQTGDNVTDDGLNETGDAGDNATDDGLNETFGNETDDIGGNETDENGDNETDDGLDDVADEEDEENAGATTGLFRAFERVGYNIDRFLTKNPEKRAQVAAMRLEKLEHKKRVMIEKGKYAEAEAIADEQAAVQEDLTGDVTDLEEAVANGDASEESLDALAEELAGIEDLAAETETRLEQAVKRNPKAAEKVAAVIKKSVENAAKVKVAKRQTAVVGTETDDAAGLETGTFVATKGKKPAETSAKGKSAVTPDMEDGSTATDAKGKARGDKGGNGKKK